jgi:TPR repeat protein
MKASRLMFTLLLASSVAVVQLVAEQTKTDQRPLKEVRAKAEAGDADSQVELGLRYEQVQAAKWYRKAAEQNLAEAQYNLGVCYGKGEGVAEDQVEAVKWYRKAAEQNYATAQYNLSVRYATGGGVAKDNREAYKWRLLAARQGDEDAKKSMTVLESKLTPEQIAEGQKLAREFKPR